MYKFVRSFKKKPLNEDKKEEFNKDQANVFNTSSNLSSENEKKKDQNNMRNALSSTKPKSRHESLQNSKVSPSVKRSYSYQKKNTTSSDKSENQSSPYRCTSTSSLTTLSSSTITKSSSSSSSSSLNKSLQSSIETVNNTKTINSERDLDLLDKLFSNFNSKRIQDDNSNHLVTNKLVSKIPNNTQNERKLINIIRHIDKKNKMVLTDKRGTADTKKPLFKSRIRKDTFDEDNDEKNSKPLKNVNFRILKNSHRNSQSDGSFRIIAQQPVRDKNHFLEISSAPRKRIRSPSNHEYNSLLNLAHCQSHNNRNLKKITIKPLPRSLSVNYLYHKRQGDLRRYQKNALIKIRLKRAGFTTEDIDDIYMPKQLDMFERKLKQSMDISDNSELEEAKMRQERLSRVRNKRLKREIDKNIPRSKIIINYRSAPFEQTNNQYLDDKKSYLEEAKRKLSLMKNSNGYYYNLNNKLKSSVTNLIRASQDLARTSEIKGKLVNRNWSLKEVYDLRRNQIRTNNLDTINADNSTQIQNNYTCDDINNVYMPWMIENYGRKLTIEAIRRKNDAQKRTKSPYVSQYYAKSNDLSSIGHHDMWLIDNDIRCHVKNASNSNLSDSDVSMTDTETSSDDTRPIVPQKINKPDNSLKNKILKAINKSLLTSEVSGIDLNLLKLNDSVKRTLKRVEKKALERDLEHDLIRSFSCSHLADLRKEDIKYVNMRVNGMNSYSTEDVQDLYIPKMLESFKLKLAVEKECKPRRILAKKSSLSELNQALVTSPPPVQIKSPSIATPVSPHYSNTENLFKQIIQERITEFDHRIASEISSSAKKKMHDDDVSTDNDQDESIEISSESDDFCISEHDLKHFDSSISKSKIESAINKSLTLKNPGELISDFYISNMNFAMRYSVEYIQKIANEMRLRRHQQDSMYFHSDREAKLRDRVQRSFSVDRLYAVRREHLRYSNGAQNKRISFTTDDIQDIYMPSCLDNYKRKIAVELERRRRQAELTNVDLDNEMNENLNLVKTSQPIVLDDLDIFLIEKSNFTIQDNKLEDKLVKIDQPVILVDDNKKLELIDRRPIELIEQRVPVIGHQPVINIDRPVSRSVEIHQRPQRAKYNVESEKFQNIRINSIMFKNAEDKARFERAKVSIQKRLSFFENYPLISQIEPVVHDEPMQIDQAKLNFEDHPQVNYPLVNQLDINEKSASSSMTSSVSADSSDSLSNIPLDNFEQEQNGKKEIIDRAQMALVPDDKTFNHKPFSVIKLEQVPVLEKSKVNYEEQNFDFAQVNLVKPINMPSESLDIVSRLYSNYFQPEKMQIHEPNLVIVQDQLKSQPLIHNPNSVIYNAPMVKKQDVQSVRQEIIQPMDVNRPEYIIEEYAKKPLNSQITFLYENLNSFKTSNLKDNATIGQQENELVNTYLNYEQTFNAPKVASEDQVMDLAEQIETVNAVNVPEIINIEQLEQFERNRINVLVPTDVMNAEQIEQEEYELDELRQEVRSEENLSLKEEIENIGIANVTEFKQIEEPNVDEVSLSDAESLQFEFYEPQSVEKYEKISSELNQPCNLLNSKVYNLPCVQSDFKENVTEELHLPAIDTDQIEQIMHVQRLEICQQPNKISVLNLARQDSINSVKSQAEDISSDDKIPEYAALKQEISQFQIKPSIKKPIAFNAPILENNVFECLTANELETKDAIEKTMLAPKNIESFDQAYVEPRPVYLNQAESNVSHEEVETLQYMEDECIDKQYIEPKKEISYKTQNLSINHPVRALNLGNEKSEKFLFSGINEYDEMKQEPEFALVGKEEKIDTMIEQSGLVEVFNGPVISTKIDDFLETVKPFDPLEFDFEQQVSISTKKADLTQPNDIKVSIKQSYGQSDIEEIYYNENCSELDTRETSLEPYYRENKIDLQSPHGIKVDIVEKIGQAKEETYSIKNEEPIDFDTSHHPSEEYLQDNFETHMSMERLEKFKYQTILNNPAIGQLNIETVEQFRTDSVSNDKTNIKMEDDQTSNKKYITRIQCFNVPNEQNLKEEEQTSADLYNNFDLVESRISRENSSDYQKVGIEKKIKLNLATFTESSENDEDKIEPIRELDNNIEIAHPTIIDQNMNQASILSLNKYARCREIIELYNTYKADDFTTQLDPDIQCVPVVQQAQVDENQIKINQTRHINLGLFEQDKLSECEEISLSENEEVKPILILEPNLITDHQKSETKVISMPMEDKFSISSSSLDSLENEMPNESNTFVQYVEKFDSLNKIESLKPFNLNRVEELESPIDQVDELNENLNFENSILKSENDELNRKIDEEKITLINLPLEKSKSESEYELESFSDTSLIEKQNLDIDLEKKTFITAEKKYEDILNAPISKSISLNDSQEVDELSIDRESEYEAKCSLDETRMETYEIHNRFQSLNSARIEQNSMPLEETDSFSFESMDENYLIPISEANPVCSQPIDKNSIKFLNSAEIKNYESNFEQIKNIQDKKVDSKNLEPIREIVPIHSPVHYSKNIQLLNVPKNDQTEDLGEYVDSFAEEINLENISFDLVQNEVSQKHSKFSIRYFNSAKIESDSYSSFYEANSFNIESKSECNLEPKEECEYLNNRQIKTKFELLNAPKMEKESFSNFEEADSLRVDDDQSQFILDPIIQAHNLSFGQTKSQIQNLNAPQVKNECIESEKIEYIEPESKIKTQLEPKIEIESMNSKPNLKVNQTFNAPELNSISQSHTDDVDSLDGSEPLIEEPFVSQYNVNLTKACLNKKIIFLNAPKNQIFNLNDDEKAENFHIQISTGQGLIRCIQNEANLNASSSNTKTLAAPKIDQVDLNSEDLENFNIEILNESRLELKDCDFKLDNASRKSVIVLGAGICRNLSQTYIEKADSFESNREMQIPIIKNESYYQDYANVKEPVRVLMCEMEDSIDYTFNEDVNLFQNDKLESAQFKNESNFLNSKPDKKFLLWLNYPKLVQNEQEEAKRIDETFDYLYEKIVADIKSNESSLEKDSNMVHIEKVLSLFISNQEHVEYNEEILKFIPNHRPEVQRLILNQTKAVEFDRANKEALEQQVEPKDLSLEEDSIEEMIRHNSGSEVSLETRPSSRVIFDKSNVAQFFNQEENISQFSNFIQPSQINKITNQIISDAVKTSSLEQKLEETWQVSSDINCEKTSETDLANIPIMKYSNWNDLMTSSQNNENTLSIHSDEGSFFEHIENYEALENTENKVHSTLIDENFDLSDDLSINIRQKTNSDNDTDSTSLSETSSRMHLIECVEVLTAPGVEDSLQIQKVDINRLKVKEKSNFQTDDPKSRFKVNLKKEEIVDLRNEDKFNVTTQQEFAKKFVEQILNLNASRLGSQLRLNDYAEHSNRDINCIASKNSNEILNTLSNIKCDLSKHFADSLISEYGPENKLIGEQCVNINLMEDLSDKEELFEDFSNRLHSSSNFGEALRNDKSKESKENQVVEILAQIVKQRTVSSYTSDSDDSLENLKKNITMDSMQSFLDNVVNTAKQTINSKNQSDNSSDDETSIQEMVIFNQKLLNQGEKKIIKPDKYKISSINASLYEPVNFERDKVEIVNGASIAKVVEPNEEIKDFEAAVDIVDSVVIDHTSEDDKSTTSEEVTFERWTEETKLIKTQIYKDGNLVEEIIKQSSPELIGNILKEKIIERHEHVKHISQDVLKRVRIKSPGQSRRQSLDIQEILNEDLDGSNIIIVEPTITSIRPVSSKDNTYYIQHQQVITPGQSTGTCKCFKNALNARLHTSTLDFDFHKSDNTFFSTILPCSNNALLNNNNHYPKINIQNLKDESSLNKTEESSEKPATDATSNIKTYYGDLKAVNIDGSNDDVWIVRNDSQLKSSYPNPMKNQEKKDQMIKKQYEKIISANNNEEHPDFSIESNRNKSDSIVSITTDSYGSMQRFERPSRSELLKIQQDKQSQVFFYEDQTSTLESDKNICDKTIEESTFKEIDQSKRDDMTDLSEDENNIFNSEPQKSSTSSVDSEEKVRKNFPLRRESFELAQKDSTKRNSIARSTTSSSSSSFTANQIIIKTADSPAPNSSSNKRLLSEIRPDDLNEKSDDAKATEESDSETLKRNYEILRKKTSEQVLKSDSDILDQASFVSSHSIRSEQAAKPTVRPTKIKIVKKQKISPQDTRYRSVSPGLMRGPDMIETIETTTSMSFIMNKSINLLTEEKVKKQNADEYVEECPSQPHSIRSISIPVQVQTRSRSEPKIKPLNEPKEIKVMYRDEKKPRVTFHKYDSNEIIAVVNVPQAMETKTIKSVVDNYESSSKSQSKSTPNLVDTDCMRSKLDSWRKWPEYTVDQETDTSIIKDDFNHYWIKETPDSRVVYRQNAHVKDKDPEFEIEIEKILPVNDRTRQVNERYSTHSIVNTNVTHTEETVATRMSSGYFSGDEFRSQMANYSPSYSISNFTESPRVSATQFNVNKFLNNPSRSRSKTTTALDEFNKFYQSLGLDDDFSERANNLDTQNSSIKKLIDSENYSDYYYKKSIYSRQPSMADIDQNLKNNMHTKPYFNKDDASILNVERKRSSSMSNLNNEIGNLLILPSPTSADYLRNKTRESALVNVVMKPAKTLSDIETSQILYDDMAYRQLRKDSDAFKLSQIKANRQNLPNNLTNITSLPISYAPGQNSSGDYYQNSNAARTIRMIKQKDASNKTLRKNSKSSIDLAHRYFSNEINPELNDYYDSLNHVKVMNNNFESYH